MVEPNRSQGNDELPATLKANLLDPAPWREGLDRYARTMNLAVALTDAEGQLLGPCLNPQPTWSLLHTHQAASAGGCPFALGLREPCRCIADALNKGGWNVVQERTGLVHFAVPLVLNGHPLGALVAGQVFDRYPGQRALEQAAKQCGLSPEAVWQRARSEHPVKRATLHIYGDLLMTFGQTFLQTRYHSLREAERLAELTRVRDQAVTTRARFKQARGALRHSYEALRQQYDRLQERVKETLELAHESKAVRGDPYRQTEVGRQALLQQMVTAQEEERRRIARELHDQMGQRLTALSLGLKSLENALPESSPAYERLQSLQRLTDLIGREVHQLARDLRPTALDDLGLHTTLLHYVEEWSERSGVEVDFHSAGLDRERLPLPLETTLYRIIQEGLTNVVKHAHAGRVSLVLQRTPEQVLAVLEDDGRGFDAEAVMDATDVDGHLGLLGMRERAALAGGTLTVESTPGKGTAIFVRIPSRRGGGRGIDI
jgi:signal transduction histidine kinase